MEGWLGLALLLGVLGVIVSGDQMALPAEADDTEALRLPLAGKRSNSGYYYDIYSVLNSLPPLPHVFVGKRSQQPDLWGDEAATLSEKRSWNAPPWLSFIKGRKVYGFGKRVLADDTGFGGLAGLSDKRSWGSLPITWSKTRRPLWGGVDKRATDNIFLERLLTATRPL